MTVRKIYIAGPMTGHPDSNFPAFFAAEAKLELDGWVVANPARNEMDNPNSSLRELLKWDFEKVCESDAIYMLPGWEQSGFAIPEWHLAKALQKTYPEYRIIYG